MAKQDVVAKVEEILSGFLAEQGLLLYKAEYKKEGPDWKLKIFLDKPDDKEEEYITIEECETVTSYLNVQLDEQDFIDRSYTLEVSSPGLDRELIKPEDFVRFRGRAVDVRLYEPLNGSREFCGTLLGREDGVIRIEADGEEIEILADKVSKINLAVIF